MTRVSLEIAFIVAVTASTENAASQALAAALPLQDPPAVVEAQKLQQSGDYGGAAEAWQSVVDTNPNDGRGWYQLGRSLHAAGRLEQAIPAHERAAAFPQIEANGNYNLACAHALLGHIEDALDALEHAVGAGFANAALANTDSDLDSLREHERFRSIVDGIGLPLSRRLHFWIGEWDCYVPGNGTLSGRNDLIPRVGETVIHEVWQPVQGGPGGESWNYYDPGTRTWRQHWTSNGVPFVFVGKPKDNGILFEGPHLDGQFSRSRKRMFIRPIAGGRVQQTGTQSSDGGKTWQPDFDLVYVPRGEPFRADTEAAVVPVAPLAPARQFDFLIGEWRMDVEQYDAQGQLIRSLTDWSRVRSRIGGAALIDEWGGSGFTVRTWDPRQRVWRLFWTDRSALAGRMQLWEGTFEDGVGTFIGGTGVPYGAVGIVSKIEFSEITDDSVLWKMWKSPDGGKSWILDYIRRYKRLTD